MFLKNCWYPAFSAEEVTREPKERTVCGKPLVFYRTEAGTAITLSNLCPHRFAPLSLGRVIGDLIECPYHGMRFDADGKCRLIPGQHQIPEKANIPAYPTVERWGMIWVWFGRPALLDESKIPAMPWRSDAGWNAELAYYYHVPAAHTLTMDNLLDLGHGSFVHGDTVGVDPAELDYEALEWTVKGNCVRNLRRYANINPAPVVKRWGDFAGQIDERVSSEWTPPCNINILLEANDTKTAVGLHLDHLIAPETENSHHYWVLVSRNFKLDDREMTERVRQGNIRVHQQDLAIILAQQRIREKAPGLREMAIRQDRGIVAAHRVLARLVEQEKRS